MKCSMSERYVKDILEKLEEIEKLHAKLRSLVPRVKNHDSENISKIAREGSKNTDKQSTGNGRNSSEQKPVDIDRDSCNLKNISEESKANVKKSFFSDIRFTNLTSKLKNQSINDKWRKFRNNSIDFVTEQWYDKHDKIRNFLSNINDGDIVLVNRAAQTSDDEQETICRKRSVSGNEVFELSSRQDQLPEDRRRTKHQLLERLLEHFNYSRDSDVANEDRLSIHDHRLGNHDPRKVQKALLLPDEEAETLRVVSSARRISVNDNKESSSGTRVPKFLRKYIHRESLGNV